MAFSFFFRDRQTLEAAVLLTLDKASGKRNIYVWDAGSAMGLETYTIALMFAERMSYFAFKRLKIDATDIDESGEFGSMIKEGNYPEERCKRVPKEYIDKYFVRDEESGKYRISTVIKEKVNYERNDLRELKPLRTGYDMVVCKNVLLHIQPVTRIEIFRMFHNVLNRNGILAMEQTQELPEQLSGYFEKVSQNDKIFRKIENADN